MEENKFYVYAHIDPRDKSIRYIGKGTGDRAWRLKCRAAKHGSWIKSLESKGLLPEIKILEYFEKEQDALSREKELILNFLSINPNFCNMLEGGIGAPSGEKHPMFGHKHSAETREKLSRAASGRKKSAEHRKNIGLAHKGKKKSPEATAKRVEKVNKKVFCVELNITFTSVKEASTYTGVDASSIVRICKGKQKTSNKKLTFKYPDPT